jgi:hypothetical protein
MHVEKVQAKNLYTLKIVNGKTSKSRFMKAFKSSRVLLILRIGTRN